jgi:hypothetical protein
MRKMNELRCKESLITAPLGLNLSETSSLQTYHPKGGVDILMLFLKEIFVHP